MQEPGNGMIPFVSYRVLRIYLNWNSIVSVPFDTGKFGIFCQEQYNHPHAKKTFTGTCFPHRLPAAGCGNLLPAAGLLETFLACGQFTDRGHVLAQPARPGGFCPGRENPCHVDLRPHRHAGPPPDTDKADIQFNPDNRRITNHDLRSAAEGRIPAGRRVRGPVQPLELLRACQSFHGTQLLGLEG